MNLLNGQVNVRGCNEWSSFYEEKLTKDKSGGSQGEKKQKSILPQKLNDIEHKIAERNSTGFKELDMVLGGGLVNGSLVLLGGEPRNR